MSMRRSAVMPSPVMRVTTIGSSNRAISASASQNASTAALEQLRAEFGRGRRRVADVAVRPEVVRQPAEADAATEPHVAVGGERLGHVAGGDRHVDEIGREVQHQRRLLGAAVDPHAEFGLRRMAALVRRHARMGEERHQPVVRAAARGWRRRPAPSCRRDRS